MERLNDNCTDEEWTKYKSLIMFRLIAKHKCFVSFPLKNIGFKVKHITGAKGNRTVVVNVRLQNGSQSATFQGRVLEKCDSLYLVKVIKVGRKED